MPSTEEQVKSVILKHKDGARKQQIAGKLKMSLDYIGLVCGGLERKGEIVFSEGKYVLVSPRREIKRKIKKDTKSNTARGSAMKFSLSDIPGMAEDLINTLKSAGYTTIESLAGAPIAKFMQEVKLELHEAAGLINHARKILGKSKGSEVGEKEEETS